MKMKVMLVGVLAIAGLATAQKPKSPKELEAVQAVISAQTPDAKIAAVVGIVDGHVPDARHRPRAEGGQRVPSRGCAQ